MSKLSSMWPIKKVKDLSEVITGGTPSTTKKEFWENGTIPWLPSGDLKNKPIKEAHKFITTEGLKNSAAKIMPRNTVVIALTGATTGQTGILELEACANQSVTGILPSNEHDPKYLFYFLQTKRKKILAESYGAAQPHISQGYVKNIEIVLPPLHIQQKIVSTLDKIEKIKQMRNESNRLTNNYLKSVFLEMFSLGIKNESEHEELENITLRITDGEHITPRRVKNGIYLLSARNILNHKIALEDVDFIDEVEFKKISKRILPQLGDVLVSCSGSVGRVTRVKDDIKFQLVRSVALIRPDSEKIHPVYLEYFFESDYMQKQISKSINQSSQANLFQGKIKKLKIYLPSINIQNKFAIIVKKVERMNKYQKESRDHIDNLFNNSMQKVSRGELAC